ncbi:CENP-B N-terminal DNA-binding domain [Popillia japonica]|uniref:CENP-B N-terminal DNA-binding domain n=1 Tax=Popillia japonica TaxID=7064 RepID=A0AAW1HVA3_POPJA
MATWNALRNYVKRNLRAQWSLENLQAAIADIRDKKASIREISRTYKVPVRTLMRRIKANDMEPSKPGRKSTLGTENEKQLVHYIKQLEKCNFPATMRDIQILAYKFVIKNGITNRFNHVKQHAGYDWIIGFLKRHPEITIRKAQGLSIARMKGMNKEEVDDYFDLLGNIFDEHGFYNCPRKIYNVDETGVQLNNPPDKACGIYPLDKSIIPDYAFRYDENKSTSASADPGIPVAAAASPTLTATAPAAAAASPTLTATAPASPEVITSIPELTIAPGDQDITTESLLLTAPIVLKNITAIPSTSFYNIQRIPTISCPSGSASHRKQHAQILTSPDVIAAKRTNKEKLKAAAEKRAQNATKKKSQGTKIKTNPKPTVMKKKKNQKVRKRKESSSSSASSVEMDLHSTDDDQDIIDEIFAILQPLYQTHSQLLAEIGTAGNKKAFVYWKDFYLDMVS